MTLFPARRRPNWPGILSLSLCLCLWDGSVWAQARDDADPAPRVMADAAPRIVDGDTLWVAGVPVRLRHMDAPEVRQGCRTAAGDFWACGVHATRALREAARGGVRCHLGEQDAYQRTLGTCEGDGGDLGAAMVGAGLAAAWGPRYAGEEAAARAAGRGVWGGEWVLPWRWRQMGHPPSRTAEVAR